MKSAGWRTHRLPTGRDGYIPIIFPQPWACDGSYPVPGERMYDRPHQAWDAAWRFLNPDYFLTFFGAFRKPWPFRAKGKK
jgi:hypothetical protein